MKDKLLELFKGYVFEVTEDTFSVDVEDRAGLRSFMEISKTQIPEKYQERIFEGNYFTFIITKKRNKMNLGRIRYWTQDELDRAEKLAKEFYEKVMWIE